MKPFSFIKVITLCSLSNAALAQPLLSSIELDVDENTTNGTVVGQVVATGGAATRQLTLEVGSLDTKNWKTAGDDFVPVSFSSSFSQAPIVFTQVQSYGNYTVPYYWDTYSSTGWQYKEAYEVLVRTRQQNTTSTGFETVIETDLRVGGGSVVEQIGTRESSEKIGWMAISESASGVWSERPFEIALTPEAVTQANYNFGLSGPFDDSPIVVGNIATTNDSARTGLGVDRIRWQDVRVFMDELDDNDHNAEAVSLLAVQGGGLLYDTSGKVIAEVGSYSTEDGGRNNADTINLIHTFSDPVVFVHPFGTDANVYNAAWRFTNVSNNRFSGYLHDEREHLLSSIHGDLDLQYLVVERGAWTIEIQNYTYEITAGNDSGAFAIDALTGVITVADGSQLDFESGDTGYGLSVKVTDGSGASNTASVDITVNDVSDSLNTEAHILIGTNADDQLGWATSPGGDINGDGYDDFVLSARGSDINGSDSGRVYVVFGDGAGNLASIADIESGTGGFVINGEAESDVAGFAIAGGGDVNGDGLADIAIGAPYASPNEEDSGKVYVVFGKQNTNAVELSAIAAEGNDGGFVLFGNGLQDYSGGSLALGDVNGDRLADVIIGETHRPNATGGAFSPSSSVSDTNFGFVVYGKSDGGAIELSAIAADDDDRGFAIDTNTRFIEDRFRWRSVVSPIGDFNSDGRDDFLINKGIISDTQNTIVFGRVGGESLLLSSADDNGNGIAIYPETGNYGWSIGMSGSTYDSIPSFVSGKAGDVNADGIDDVVLFLADIGCCDAITYPRAYVVFGVAGTETDINLADIAQGVGGFIIDNDAPQVDYNPSDFTFGSISGAGDINGDGFDDLMIGDMYADNNNGRAYIVFGKADTNPVYLNDVVNNVGGYFAVGSGSENLGHWLSQAGDVNGDGISDMLFGAHLSDPTSGNNAGKTYVFISKGEAITQWGSEADDVLNLSGQTSASNISGMTGNDQITKSIFADVIFAGPGDDTITLNDTNIARIEGGQGTDTIVLAGADMSLNIANRASLVRSVEVFDINGTGANTLAFNKNVSGKPSVTIRGGADDTVISTNQTWVDTTVVETLDGLDYRVYSSGFATMYLQMGVNITVNASPTVDDATFAIDEYTEGGTVVGTVNADANDAGDSVTFSIIAGNDSGTFKIDQSSGRLSLADSLGQLDYESGASYALMVRVVDVFGATDEAMVTVNVNDYQDLNYTLAIDVSGSASIWGDDFLVDLFSQEIQAGEEVSTNLPGSVDMPMFTLNASGEIGMKTELNTDGGSVNANLPMTYAVSFPDEVKAGVPFQLASSLTMDDGAQMDVSTPEFSLKGTAWMKNYSLGVEAKFPNTLDDLSFTDTNMSGAYAEEVVTVESDAESASTAANNDDPFLFETIIDLPEWVVQSLDLPDQWGYFQQRTSGTGERCIDDFFGYAGEDLSARWDYYLFEQSLNATASLRQDFRIELKPTATMTMEDGTVIDFDPSENTLVTPQSSYDANGDGVIEATIEVRPNPIFRNDSELKAYLDMPLKAVYMNYNMQEAICRTNGGAILYQNSGLIYEKDEEGPLLDTNLFEARISSSPFGGQTDFIEDIIEFNLNSAVFTQEVRFDLCDEGSSACAASPINDADSDGMPDEWETLYNLDPNDPNDADLDGDNDTFTNKEEYDAGSDPADINDVPVYAPIAVVVNQTILATPSGRTIELDGSQSEHADYYQWTQTAGPRIVLSDSTSATPSFEMPEIDSTSGVDQFVFELSAGNSSSISSAVLTVNLDLAPIADAGADQPSGNLVIQPGALVSLNASNSSDDRFNASNLIYSWNETSSTNVALDDSSSKTPSFYAPFISANGGAVTFEVSVSDGLNDAANDSVIINIDSGTPSADAGSDVTGISTGDQVCLDASNSADTSSGSISAYHWVQSFGNAVALSDDTAMQPCFTWPIGAATLGFELTVTDNDGLMATDSVLLSAANIVVPVCHAGTDRAYAEGETVTLDGSLSSISSGAINYLWSQDSGSAVTILDPSAKLAMFTAPEVVGEGESLRFTLSCSSEAGVLVQDEVVLTIGDGIAPVANAGIDQNVSELDLVCLDASASTDVDGDPLTFKWSQIASTNGDSVSFDNPTSEQTCFTAPATDDAGGVSYTFELAVTEDGGALSDSDEVIVNVSRINQAPLLTPITDISGIEGQTVTLSASASDGDGDALSYSWRQDSGSSGRFIETDQASVDFTLPYVGAEGEDIDLTVAVSDGDLTNSWTFSATVNDGAPVPVVTAPSSTGEPAVTLTESSEEQVIHRFVLNADQGGSELYEVIISIDGSMDKIGDLSMLRVYYDSNQDGELQEDEALLYQGEHTLTEDSITTSLLRAQALDQGDNHFLVTAELTFNTASTEEATGEEE